MCLIAEKGKPKIAKKEIKAFKILKLYKSKKYYTLIMSKTVKFNELICARNQDGEIQNNLEYDMKYKNVITTGLHGFTKLSHAKEEKYRLDIGWGGIPQFIIISMTIPKGSEYFISTDGREIVSNKAIYSELNRRK